MGLAWSCPTRPKNRTRNVVNNRTSNAVLGRRYQGDSLSGMRLPFRPYRQILCFQISTRQGDFVSKSRGFCSWGTGISHRISIQLKCLLCMPSDFAQEYECRVKEANITQRVGRNDFQGFNALELVPVQCGSGRTRPKIARYTSCLICTKMWSLRACR